MSIADKRTKGNSVSELVNKEYITAVDKSKDNAPNTVPGYTPQALSSKLAAPAGKKNIFETGVGIDPGNLRIGLSAYAYDGDPSCDKGPAGGVPRTYDDRRLDAPYKRSGCYSNTDTTLVLRSILSHITAGLPENMVLALEVMLATQITNYSKGNSVLSQVNIGAGKDAAVLRGISSVSDALSEVGSTIKEKTKLKSLLSCIKMSGLNFDQSLLLLDIVLAGLLMQALCIGVNKFLDTIVDIAAAGNPANATLIRGVVDAFARSEGRPSADKIAIMAALPAVLPAASGSDYAASSSYTDRYMQSIGHGSPKSTSPTTDFNSAANSVSMVDPYWNKDPSGNTNLSKTKGNSFVNELSVGAMKSGTISSDAIPDNPAALPDTDPRMIAIYTSASNMNTEQLHDGAHIK